MKRGKRLERRTALARGTPISRRSRLAPKPLPELEARQRAEVRGLVFARDGFRCVLSDDPTALAALGPCHGHITYHHRQKASQGGPYTVDNGLTLCLGHNDEVENKPSAAFLLGLVVRSTPLRDTPPQSS